MANALYDKGRENFLGGDIDWDAGEIRVLFHDEDDDPVVLTTDDALEDILPAARVAVSAAGLASKTKTDGVADAADITLSSVTGDQFESIDLYKHTGVEATSLLLCNIDTATGLPCTPNSGDITVQWQAASPNIFKL